MSYLETRNIEELCALLGLPRSHAARVRMRRDLVIAIKRTIEKNEWTHADAAGRANVGRTVVTAVVNGNLRGVSTDRLIDIAHNLGLKIHLKVA
jgi:predicted XRE-type DNA-binding protein